MQGGVGKIETDLKKDGPGRGCSYSCCQASQSLSQPSLHPWRAAEKIGTIVCAHCTCIAGVGEACSHIAALLFAAETNIQMMKNTSCTSVLCSWLAPSCRIEYAPISQIDFMTPQERES